VYSGKGSPPRMTTTTTMGNQNADLQTFGGGTPAFVVVLFFLFIFIFPAVCLPFGHAHENILPDWILHNLSWFTMGRTKPLTPAHPPLTVAHCMMVLKGNGRDWVGSAKHSDFGSFASVLCTDEHVRLMHLLSSVHGQSVPRRRCIVVNDDEEKLKFPHKYKAFCLTRNYCTVQCHRLSGRCIQDSWIWK